MEEKEKEKEKGYWGPFADLDLEITSSQEDKMKSKPFNLHPDIRRHQNAAAAVTPPPLPSPSQQEEMDIRLPSPTASSPATDTQLPRNLQEVVKYFASKKKTNTEEVDILDICARKGIHFPHPSGWRPGGYHH